MTKTVKPIKGRKLTYSRGERIRLERKAGSPDPNDQSQVADWLKTMPRPWAIDIFAGAGGLSLGLADAGFSVVAAADRDATALESHSHNIGGLTWCGDLEDPTLFIEQLNQWGIDQVDLVAGGPPCQPFSRAGTSKIADLVRRGIRKSEDKRAGLWRAFLSVVEHLNAYSVLIENVPDFARIQSGATLTTLLTELESRGYDTHVKMLESWRFGVPQHRTRLFAIGVRDGLDFEWPDPTDSQPTLGRAIADLPIVTGGQREEELPYTGHPSTPFVRRMRRGIQESEQATIRDHVTRFVRDDDAEVFALMQPGHTYRDVPEHMRRYRSDIFADKYNRLTWDGLSRTITAHIAKDGYWYIHPSQDRTLSIREAARIQTFPDSFRFAGTPSNRYNQIGNAVPPMLAEKVGNSLYQSLTTTEVRESRVAYQETPIRDRLGDWYCTKGRSYPWREQRDPWLILLAEICLHRTRADQVAPIFLKAQDLGSSPNDMLKHRDDARELLSHLGLHWRIDLLFELAEVLTEDYGGIVPDSYEELVRLPGVGDYVASAVLCFAFGQPSVLVDTNTSRFVRRFSGNDNLARWEQRLTLYQLAKPGPADAGWNYSLLDLGALVCTAARPHCNVCPVNSECTTGQRELKKRGESS